MADSLPARVGHARLELGMVNGMMNIELSKFLLIQTLGFLELAKGIWPDN